MNLPWTFAWTLHLGAALYACNLAVGVSAQMFHAKFGAVHHWLYGVVFTAAIAATVLAFHPALPITILALAIMPLTKPGGAAHPAVATAGALGYLGAYLL
ncbi:hypothetical protein [Enhygromyxa salina]|uniref:hypothetical protein n=1 Tax=Enhygromyxa salina TaxID=215803 RepID=UPI0011B1D01E|nr:hypothetical protein [Enhygromyxa salina]